MYLSFFFHCGGCNAQTVDATMQWYIVFLIYNIMGDKLLLKMFHNSSDVLIYKFTGEISISP